MRIGIELRHVTLGPNGGIAILLREVIRRLAALHPENEYVIFCTIFNRSLLAPLPKCAEFITLPVGTFWKELDRLTTSKNLNVLFRGYPVDDPLTFPPERQIVLVPDIQHEYFPEFFDPATLRFRRLAFTRALAHAGAVGTLSEFVRGTLRAQPSTRCTDIFLMSPSLAHGRVEGDLTAAEVSMVPEWEYFLFPANLWPHKNHRRTLQAFQQFLSESGKPMELVLTGHPAGWKQIHKEFESLPVRHLGFVSPPLLRNLYERARALLFFSLYEGFGMPLLEAFAARTPVLCSNTTSLPEIGADAVLSCDPMDVNAMSRLMGRIVVEHPLRTDLIGRGLSRLDAYSWDQAAENLHAACLRVARVPQSVPLPALPVKTPLPLVSIVTPSYNQGRFLRRTVDSVLKQTYPHIEYRVVDGGSTDESIEILKSYGNRFPWASEPDRGQTDAINKGFRDSRGEIRGYLNSDDVLLPEAVEKVVDHFLRNPACDLLYGRATYIDEKDEEIGFYNTADYSFARLMHDCCICQPAAFWRTQIATQIGPLNDQLRYVMDFDYWIRIARAGGRIEHIHDVLASSRVYPQTKTKSARRDIYREILEVTRRGGGYTDHNYFIGLWHYLCYEQERGLARRLGRFPRFPMAMACLHHRWWNRHLYTWRDIENFVRQQAKERCLRSMPLAARVVTGIVRRARRFLAGGPMPGLLGDNWISPTCVVKLQDRAPNGEMYLAGTPATDMMLTLEVDGKTVQRRQLRANAFEEICFPAPERGSRQLVLRFSNHILDAAGRRLSFHVLGTDMFSEQDLHDFNS